MARDFLRRRSNAKDYKFPNRRRQSNDKVSLIIYFVAKTIKKMCKQCGAGRKLCSVMRIVTTTQKIDMDETLNVVAVLGVNIAFLIVFAFHTSAVI